MTRHLFPLFSINIKGVAFTVLRPNIRRDFKIYNRPFETDLNGQSQTLKSTRLSWTVEPRPKWHCGPFEPGLNGRRKPETGGH